MVLPHGLPPGQNCDPAVERGGDCEKIILENRTKDVGIMCKKVLEDMDVFEPNGENGPDLGRRVRGWISGSDEWEVAGQHGVVRLAGTSPRRRLRKRSGYPYSFRQLPIPHIIHNLCHELYRKVRGLDWTNATFRRPGMWRVGMAVQ